MNGSSRGPAALGFDPFGTAVGLAVISGGLAITVPFLAVLTGTLAALALASWAVGRPRGAPGRRLFRRRSGGWAAAAVAVGAVLYLDPPGPFAPFRALALALALTLLWMEERGGIPVLPGGL
jgi:hypothetical protein